MPSLVNRVPPGLLSLLGIKALGVNPSILSDTLAAHLDVTDLYTAVNAELLTGNTVTTMGVPGMYVVTSMLVPAGECWIVTRANATLAAVLAAATTYRVRIAVYDNPNARVVHTGDLANATVGENFVSSFQSPLILSPGEQLGCFAESVTVGTAVAARLSARVLRLAI